MLDHTNYGNKGAKKQKKKQKANAELTFVCIGAMTSVVHCHVKFQAVLIEDCQGTSLVCKKENK